jgi:drug/metabolite transporter (DMT)-like permease
MPVVPVVLFAAALHASWNAVVKSVTDRARLVALIGATTAALAAPLAVLAVAPARAAWAAIGVSILLHLAYNLMLVSIYRAGDYNQVYPVARGTAPPVVAIASVLAVGERLSADQVIGLLVLSGGLLVLGVGRRGPSSRAVGLAMLTGLLIAGYTVIDGIGVRHAHSVLGYAGWLFFGEGAVTALVLWASGVRSGRAAGAGAARGVAARGVVQRAAAAAALSLAAYMLVLWAQEHARLAVVAALRETSVVFAAVLGAYLLDEDLPLRRIAASLLVAAGAAALALG